MVDQILTIEGILISRKCCELNKLLNAFDCRIIKNDDK